MIDKQSKIPIYYQLEQSMKEQIQEGELEEHEVLPPEREIAERYSISRMTVRQALNNLVQEGILYRQQGKGTFVSAKKDARMKDLTSFTEEMRERGFSPGSHFLAFEEVSAPSEVTIQLSVAEGAKVVQIKRVRLANEEPMCIETVWIPRSLFPTLKKTDVESSFYSAVERAGFEIVSAEQSFEASVATRQEAKRLGISEGSVVMRMKQTSYLETGEAFEFVDSVYRGDRYTFFQTLSR
ncbi:LOW QUALITY PROTEIN: predicted transcriptional regulator of N-acetylglucosamine utilization, GntR family [Geomicrobium sp. JCM 19037]|nr:LOW QUALITY PROTEIN: predicted transcriptional regulator of N-acetylglucosamine utilization, GntR family [Geomicrobium sp. JCM 19037]